MEKKRPNFIQHIVLTFLCLLLGNGLMAQVTGTVSDGETGEALIGASIFVKGTQNGTITDIDGVYSLDAAASDVLVFSFVGYTTVEEGVNGRTVVDVALAGGEILEEVVVTGYQTQRKRDITGAVSVVSTTELNLVPAASVGQKLAGKAAGVTISTSGTPGDGTAIRIRGFNSLTNNDPLIVIDGVPTKDSFLNSINPNDIESIQVLKDAASASVYGARASNGVIVITTKKGRQGKTKVTYDAYYGVQNTVNRLDLSLTPVNTDDMFKRLLPLLVVMYRAYIREVLSLRRIFGDPSQPYAAATNGVPGSGNLLMRTNATGTDWWDELISSAPIHEHNLNVSGGSDNATFNISGNYFNQQGTVLHTFFERFMIRANSQFNAGKFTFGENVSVSRINSLGQRSGNQSEQNIITNIIRIQPTVPLFDEGGGFAGPKAPGMGLGNNPLKGMDDDKDDIGNFNRLFGNVFSEVDLIEGLSARTSLGFDYGNGFTQNAVFPNFEAREPNQFSFNYSENWDTNFQWTWTNTINFVRNFGEVHDLNAVVGYEAFKQNGRNIGGGLVDYFVFGLDSRYINTGLADPDSRSVGSGGFKRSYNSYFAKVDYVYDDFLILSGTVRNDGASEFGPNFRRGTFPAGSIGVRLSKFLSNEAIEDFKVRYSFGINGNNAIRSDNAFAIFGGGTGSSFYDITGSNSSLATGFALQARGNPDGKWEELKQHNFGIDMTLWNGKFGFVFDFFDKETQDLLFTAAEPGAAGSASPAATNVATMKNVGFDAQLFYKDQIASDLNINLGLTLGHYSNEITRVSNSQTQFFTNSGSRIGTTSINRVGDAIGSFYGLETDGIFASQGDVDAHATQPGAAIGRLRFKDQNSDGVVDDNDRIILGSFHPSLTSGFSIGLNYKDFDFNTFIFGTFGNEIFNFNRLFTDFSQFEANVRVEVLEDAWSPSNLTSEIPAPDYGGRGFNSRPSSYYVEDASYVRLENIQVGYRIKDIPGLNASARVYIQGQNLLTFTGYTGLDPAMSNFGRADTDAGLDFGNYPSNKSIIFGVNLEFEQKLFNILLDMKHIKYFIFIAVLGVITFACSGDFLELNPQGALDGSALQSPDGIEASLISAYSMLDGWNGQWGNFGPWGKDAGHWIWAGVASDDAHKGSDASDIADITQIELYQWLPSNGLLEDLFVSRFEGIARVNATMNLNNSSEAIDAARKTQIDAESRLLRAHYHFDLYRTFKNIPYYVETDQDFRKSNDSDILPAIITDLETAVSGLPVSQGEVGRATKGAAQAYLGKVKMFAGDYAGAKAAFDAVVNSGQYSLTDCFHDNFNAATDINSEAMLAVQFSVNDGDPGANNANYGTRLGFPHSGSPFGCCGFNQPSADLVNSYLVDDNGLPMSNAGDVALGSTVDPRLDWTVGRDNVPYYDHGTHQPEWIRDRNFGGPYSPKKTQYHSDQNQFNSAASAGAWGPQASAINYNIIRYADVLLMLAEAEVEAGSLERARELVNMVRTRAGNCAQGPGGSSAEIQTSIDDPAITWATYKVGTYPGPWTDATAARSAVRLERRLELAMEGHRLYDLRRWGTLPQTMNAYFARNAARDDSDLFKRRYLSEAFTVEAKHNAYPLPGVQVDLSEVDGAPMLKQNDGF